MKTINTNEDCPSEFFIFINLQNPIVYNNAEKIGVITSSGITAASMDENMLRSYISGNADYLPFIPNPNASPAISMYQLGVMNTYRVEYNAEISRKENSKYILQGYLQCMHLQIMKRVNKSAENIIGI